MGGWDLWDNESDLLIKLKYVMVYFVLAVEP